MKVICISGKARSGKDRSAEFMKTLLEREGHRVLVTHFADLLKYICETFFGWNGVKDKDGRDLLQRVGTDFIRAVSPDYWVNFIAGILSIFKDDWDYVLIPDCRFPNEYEVLKSYGFDTTLVRITRFTLDSPLTPEQQEHPSETALDDYAWDYELINGNDIESMYNECEWFLHFVNTGEDIRGDFV